MIGTQHVKTKTHETSSPGRYLYYVARITFLIGGAHGKLKLGGAFTCPL